MPVDDVTPKPPASPARSSPSLRRRRLGMELRRLREASTTTREQAGERLDCSASKISRIENGDVGVRKRDLTDLMDLYRVTDTAIRDELYELARQSKSRKDWWAKYNEFSGAYRRFIEYEPAAVEVRSVNVTGLPGRLQTDDYARAIIAATAHMPMSDDDVESEIELRRERQRRLLGPDPLEARIILDEAVLRRQVGGPDIMDAQIAHLLDLGESTKLHIQVIPFAAGAHSAMNGPFEILRFPPPDPDVVYCEGNAMQIVMDNPTDLAWYAQRFDQLSSKALSPEQSAQMMRGIVREQR